MQYSVAVRNAQNDAMETTIGASPTLEIRSGAAPANCAAADSGTLLVSMTLPADWLTGSASGLKSKNGTWSGTGAAAGTAGHWRIKAGATCHMQGTLTATGGGGDLELDNTSIAVSQAVAVNTFDVTRGNA